MSTYFQDKVIWITGASSGIGEALTYELARESPYLVLSSRRAAELERVARQSGLSPDRLFILPLDLTDYEEMPGLVGRVLDRFGRIDILINNGGISQRSSVMDTDVAVARRIMDVNFTGTAALTKAVVPYMIEARSGQIISVASVAGVVATPKRSSYAAAKGALIRFMEALRAELHEYGIHVGVILPGYVRTQISVNALLGDGSPQGSMDSRTEQGISPEACAEKMVHAIRKQEDQTYIAGTLEMLGVYLQRFFPALLRIMVRKVKAS
ncbi:SDR family oxidoreductase [Flavilitoribacter nigricans]|uniref:Short chain dehydrogenase n=1 Tax=Flavilitoribacter nigricans (strain ATCC 23147 / DSM 23189 / NBRC 102662 / NCIMB 1420 / SS-2) TaxID=1122177 RepID=A0A2D0NDU1_FLAN2|nr:SDR family oxidoreductase [Flavilitoribacter nigricans]PHN06662.1 short chain dehydrogenase [Flavilitoribacter nigricans DSM 23189 = NBRC 102662]